MREHTDGDFPFANEWNAIARGVLEEDTAVVRGCAVGDGGTDDETIDVAAGEVRIGGAQFSIDAQSVTLESADPDDDRFDVAVAGRDGQVEAVTGTPSSTPKAPSIPDDHVLLAIVGVPAGATGVTEADLYDARPVAPNAQYSTAKAQAINRRLAGRQEL